MLTFEKKKRDLFKVRGGKSPNLNSFCLNDDEVAVCFYFKD